MCPHAKEILIEEIVMKTFLTVVIGVILTSAPAMAEQKLFLSCTNGRDPQTNVANIVEPNISIVIDREAKTFAPYDPRWTLPIERLDDQTITARMRTNIDPQTVGELQFIVDPIGGHLTVLMSLSNCAGPGGVCINGSVYDCSTSPPKPKF
jgi:hypothetical protein